MGLNQRAKSLIERAAPGLEPTALDRDRTRARIAERLALGAAAGVVVSAAKPSLALAKLVAISLLGVGVAGGVAFVAIDARRASPPSEVAATVIPNVAPSGARSAATAPSADAVAAEAKAPEAPVADEASSRIAATAPSASAPASAAATPRAPDITAELALLREAQVAMSRGDSGAAMRLLAEHDRRFPNGALAENRAAAQIFALCDLGRTDEARSAGDAFLEAHPGSTFADRVRASCAGKK